MSEETEAEATVEPKAKRKKKEKPPVKSLRELGIEKFETREVHRSELKNAEYNPRVLGDEERRRLKRVLKKNGMLEPPVWNKRSGNIVGGHQRASVLDAIVGSSDYRLTVAVVDLDDKEERQANLALNNSEAQGSWDLEGLANMFRPGDLDIDATGFSMSDLATFFGEDVSAKQDPAALDALAAKFRERRDAQEGHLQKIAQKRDGSLFYSVLIFSSDEERSRWQEHAGFPDDERFVDGRAVSRAMGLDLEPDGDG